MESVGVVLASVREGRRGEAFAKWISVLLAERDGVEPVLLDLREWSLPAFAYPAHPSVAEKTYAHETLARRWVDRVRSLDAFVLVTPEYNRGYPGQLKNALDHAFTSWNYKPVAFVGYGGSANGTRVIQALHHVAIELRMVPLRDELGIGLVGLAVDEHGFPSAEHYRKRAAGMLDELLFWSRLLKEGRARRG